ncbi:MAG TPA: hypothetical protein VMQ78_11810 [Candidatus Limnocylindria bacterium]|nr:hypothetical protein [Candidatus Limnocylindria bacterium]
MIEDLEGATIEPSRRRHVAALSAATAAVALVLFLALVTPRTPVDAPSLAATPAPSPTDGTVVTFAAPDRQWIPVSDPRISEVRVNVGSPDYVTSTVCAAGVGSSPPVHLMVLDRTGQPMAAYTSGTTGRFVPLPHAYVGSAWLTVPCDTSDVFPPRMNRAR